MFYEEQIINGVLMFRHTPDGEWVPYSIEDMSKRIVDIESLNEALRLQLGKAQKESEECGYMMGNKYEHGYMMGKKYEKDRIKELLGL